MLSGIQPLTLGEGSSGLGNEIMMVNSDGSNSDVFASEVRYSMPKKGEVIDLNPNAHLFNFPYYLQRGKQQ